MSDENAVEAKRFDVVIDGEKLGDDWTEQMTFREQRMFRSAIRELLGQPDADVDPSEMAFVDFLPALVYVIRKRKDPEYELDAVLDAKPSDFLVEVPAAPPTRAVKATRSTRARST